jgi:hypothetical protein
MIKINLLPPDLRPKREKRARVRLRLPAQTGLLPLAVEVLALVFLLLFTVKIKADCRRQNTLLAELKQTIQTNSPALEKIKKTKEEIARIEKEIAPLDVLVKNRVPWAEILNQTRDSLSKNIWLSKLVLEEQKEIPKVVAPGTPSAEKAVPNAPKQPPVSKLTYRLLLDGSALSDQNGNSLTVLADFVDRLSRNQYFAETFSTIKLLSCKSQKIDVEANKGQKGAAGKGQGAKVKVFEVTDFQLELSLQQKEFMVSTSTNEDTPVVKK